MKKIFLFFLLLSASGAYAQISPSVYKLPGDTVKAQNLLYVKGVKVDSTTYSTKALLSTYLTKAQVVAGYYPLSSGNTDATNIASNTASIALLAPLASPNFTGGISLSGNLSKAAVFGTTGFGLSVAPATYTSTTSTGTTSFQGTYTFGQPTLAASSATTLTNASTLYIDNAPIAGTNVTITTPYALYVNNGQSFFNGFANFGGGFGTTGSTSSANFFTAGGSTNGSTSSTLVQFGGSSAINYRALFDGSSIGTLTIGNSYANVAIGSSPMSKAASGTNAWLVNAMVNTLGTISGSGSTITNTAALYVGAASTAGTNNYGIFSVGNIFSQAAVIGTSVRGTAVAFASLPSPAVEGMLVPVTDSSTSTYGATIAGSGANHVLAYYNGTAWVVN